MLAVLLLAWEGLICIVLMLPAGLVLSTLGGLAAVLVRRYRPLRGASAPVLICSLALPFVSGPIENRLAPANELRVVRTEIEIAAARFSRRPSRPGRRRRRRVLARAAGQEALGDRALQLTNDDGTQGPAAPGMLSVVPPGTLGRQAPPNPQAAAQPMPALAAAAAAATTAAAPTAQAKTEAMAERLRATR